MKLEDLNRAMELKEQMEAADFDVKRLSGVGSISVNGVTFYETREDYEDVESIRRIALKLAKERRDGIEKEIENL